MQIHEITEGILKGVDPMPSPALPKAGFATNAAEYFANKILDKAGVPTSQQGQYNPGGHMAALQGRGSAHINSQEQRIADQLAKEWSEKGTINGRAIPNPTNKDFAKAADDINKASYKQLPIDSRRVVNNMLNKFYAAQNQSAVAKSTSPMNPDVDYDKPAYQRKPPAPSAPTLDPKDYPDDPATQQLIAAARKQRKI